MNGLQELTSERAANSLSVTEHAIATLWCEALQISELPCPNDNFFVLGGDSMTMTMLEFRINEELSVRLPPGTLLNTPSLGELSAVVDKMLHGCQPGKTK